MDLSRLYNEAQPWIVSQGGYDFVPSQWEQLHDYFHFYLQLGFRKVDEEKVYTYTLACEGYSWEKIVQLADKANWIQSDSILKPYYDMALENKIHCVLAKKYSMPI
jgi:hypothetical protein